MSPELPLLYSLMLKSRLLEEAIAQLWYDGAISGEMHLGTGEEAINAGVVSHLREGDAMALDHRGTAPLFMRGVDPVLILREVLGHPGGLCAGMGGHMHMFSRDHLAASSGIVGASGPAGAGFAMAAQYLRPGSVAVSFFGEGSMNEGMMMESLNLASAWKLPMLFVCKDDDWSITVQSEDVTGGSPSDRARSLGIPAADVDGLDVGAVWNAAGKAIQQIRSGGGPFFLHARCVHLEGHFLGLPLIRIVRDPVKELPGIAVPIVQSLIKSGGASLAERIAGLKIVLSTITAAARDPRRDEANDPLLKARSSLELPPSQLQELESLAEQEILDALDRVFEAEEVLA